MTAIAITMRTARPQDLATIQHLLADSDLTTLGVADQMTHFVVAENAGTIVGCAGLEPYGTEGLLRSVAVHSDYRSRGIAATLVAGLLDQARRSGVRTVYLLTETAVGYFSRIGFQEIDRSRVDESVQQSLEFTTACCETATVMRLALDGRPHAWMEERS